MRSDISYLRWFFDAVEGVEVSACPEMSNFFQNQVSTESEDCEKNKRRLYKISESTLTSEQYFLGMTQSLGERAISGQAQVHLGIWNEIPGFELPLLPIKKWSSGRFSFKPAVLPPSFSFFS